eukprot:TRINITY_DN1422_c0_g1_i1.p1 TRINITY_DN1422_c0_g1~~TRINITY_DN1422_c0_g1_i1.p1  ORF type:complete len:135 (-),score=34.72 TRINITY_DN1422_c0_g1_i1:203-571(-)
MGAKTRGKHSKKGMKSVAVLKHREMVDLGCPTIHEDVELDAKNDPVEDVIQDQYLLTRNMMADRIGQKHHGMEYVPAEEFARLLDILFKFNCLASVQGHTEEDVVKRDSLAKSPRSSRRASV